MNQMVLNQIYSIAALRQLTSSSLQEKESGKCHVPEYVKKLYQKRWGFWKEDEVPPTADEQDIWFSAVVRLQSFKASVEECNRMNGLQEERNNSSLNFQANLI